MMACHAALLSSIEREFGDALFSRLKSMGR